MLSKTSKSLYYLTYLLRASLQQFLVVIQKDGEKYQKQVSSLLDTRLLNPKDWSPHATQQGESWQVLPAWHDREQRRPGHEDRLGMMVCDRPSVTPRIF